MKLKIFRSQYRLLSRYCEDLSKAVAISNVAGYFLPSILPAAVRPTLFELTVGGGFSLFLLALSLQLIKKGEK